MSEVCPKCGKVAPINPQSGLCVNCVSEKLQQDTKKLDIRVEVENKTQEQLKEYNEELKKKLEEIEAEKEDYKAKLEILAERELEARMSKLGIPEHEKDYYRQNPEKLKDFAKGLQYGKSLPPSPNVPLNEQQFGLEAQKGFSSVEEMIIALRNAEREGDAQAKEILNKLMQKTMLGIQKGEKGLGLIEPQNQPSLKEITRKKRRKVSD